MHLPSDSDSQTTLTWATTRRWTWLPMATAADMDIEATKSLQRTRLPFVSLPPSLPSPLLCLFVCLPRQDKLINKLRALLRSFALWAAFATCCCCCRFSQPFTFPHNNFLRSIYASHCHAPTRTITLASAPTCDILRSKDEGKKCL